MKNRCESYDAGKVYPMATRRKGVTTQKNFSVDKMSFRTEMKTVNKGRLMNQRIEVYGDSCLRR